MQKDHLLGQLAGLWRVQKEFQLKVFFLSLTFLLMTACQVIWRPLKVAIFAKMVGASLVPDAKLYSLCFLIPLILFYSVLVDILRKHQLLHCFTLFHGVGGIAFAYLMAHPTLGIANTQTDPSRWIGWAFYFFMESFDAFFSTTFWSFADSVNSPKDAQNYYGLFVTGSKIGGIISSAGLYYILNSMPVTTHSSLIPLSLLTGSLFLLGGTWAISQLITRVPSDYMHGYSAAYRLEKKEEAQHKNTWRNALVGCIDGLLIMLKRPYVMGIFSLVVFYEVIIVIFDWRVALYADSMSPSVGHMTAYYAFYYFLMNVIGLAVSLCGTTPLLKLTSIRTALFVFPVMCLVMLVATAIYPTAGMFFATLVGLRAINYALNHPIREVLYIPTTKEIKFKAKTWTDAFGSRIAKSAGSVFNVGVKHYSTALATTASLGLSGGLTILWIIIVYFLGKSLQHALDHKKVIGQDESSSL